MSNIPCLRRFGMKMRFLNIEKFHLKALKGFRSK